MEELIQLGIDHGQGYVIARPMMSERVLEWVQCFQKNPEKGCEKAVS
jgi:EAL domain-containing protein (putative c-di-GMP-specific phosphodiesterase class I)